MDSPIAFPEFKMRCQRHDYHIPFIYHIILKKAKKCEDFGKVAGNAKIPYPERGCAYIVRSQLGNIIKDSLVKWQESYPFMKIWKYCIMPDHVHFILYKEKWTPEHLTYFIKRLKFLICDQYNILNKTRLNPNDFFRRSYCDKPLFRDRSLDGWNRYLELNPHRLAMRIQYPEFFKRINSLSIFGEKISAYGNLFFLRNPDKYAVKISRSFSKDEKEAKIKLWLEEAAKGAILVSPFISREEKEIMKLVESAGGKIILIQHEDFPPLFKPPGHYFDLCARGNLLLISMGFPPKTELTREHCNRMNALAENLEKHPL